MPCSGTALRRETEPTPHSRFQPDPLGFWDSGTEGNTHLAGTPRGRNLWLHRRFRTGCTAGGTGEGSCSPKATSGWRHGERSPGGSNPGPLPAVAMVTAAARWGQRGQGGTEETPGRGRRAAGLRGVRESLGEGGAGARRDVRRSPGQSSPLVPTLKTPITDKLKTQLQINQGQLAVMASRKFRWLLIW